jgi:hypothetical protein
MAGARRGTPRSPTPVGFSVLGRPDEIAKELDLDY